jgi:hypothetical protein
LDDPEPERELELVTEYPFTIQFVWKKTPPDQRPESPGDPPPGGEADAELIE